MIGIKGLVQDQRADTNGSLGNTYGHSTNTSTRIARRCGGHLLWAQPFAQQCQRSVSEWENRQEPLTIRMRLVALVEDDSVTLKQCERSLLSYIPNTGPVCFRCAWPPFGPPLPLASDNSLPPRQLSFGHCSCHCWCAGWAEMGRIGI